MWDQNSPVGIMHRAGSRQEASTCGGASRFSRSEEVLGSRLDPVGVLLGVRHGLMLVFLLLSLLQLI